MSSQTNTFDYRFINDDKFMRPIIPVRLRYENIILKPLAFVDSGADITLFRGDIANLLNINIENLQEISIGGVGGKIEGYLAHLELGIGEKFIPVPVIFSFKFVPNGFAGLIGQLGFFDNFVITFDRANKQLTFK